MSFSESPLLNALKTLSDSGVTPMHMPGHKRSGNMPKYLRELGAQYDITEIDGFDDLHDPKGIIKDIEDRAAVLWGARRSRILVGGSTCGVLAAVYAVTRRGDGIIMARGCHRSVYHAVELKGLVPTYIPNRFDEISGMLLSTDPLDVKNAIAKKPNSSVVVITSPTYEGVISDIAEIAKTVHEAGMVLIIDEAHGAHLGMGGFADGAVKCGADIVIQSLHKTLQCLTQTAVVHNCTDRIDDSALAHAIDIFETSSPSYLLMASVDGCINTLNDSEARRWNENIYANAEKLKTLNHLHLAINDLPNGCFDFDVSKLTVLTDGRISGYKLGEILREEYKIEIEMAAPGYIVAMSGMGDSKETISAFADAIDDIDSREDLFDGTAENMLSLPDLPKTEILLGSAVEEDGELMVAEKCCGRISAEYVMAYPPGIPVIVPGEVFSAEIIEYLNALGESGANIKSRSKNAPDKYLVLK